MRNLLGILLLALVLAPSPAAAQAAEGTDAVVTLGPGSQIENDPHGILALESSNATRWVWNLSLTAPYTTIEFQGRGLGLERAQQLVPSLVVPDTEYPLFHQFPNERVWEAEGAARVFHLAGDGDDFVLRLGVDGPAQRTLVLEVDTKAPAYHVGEAQQITPIGFYLETRTEELAYADLQVRAVGETEWIQNPTPELHVLQRFPVQGLDADTDHEVQVVFTDWAGNAVTSPIFHVRTLPAPVVEPITVTPVEPAPNSTVADGNVTVRASFDSASPVSVDMVRVFFDLKEVQTFELHGADVRYWPQGALEAGRHVVSVEVTNEEGGRGMARWTFEVAGAKATPVPAWLILLALLAAAGTMRASRRA